MYKDLIVQEIRDLRDQHAAQFEFDPKRILADIEQLDRQAQAQGRRYVRFPPRRPAGWVEKQSASALQS